MPSISTYFDKEEAEFLKGMPKGFLRRLVRLHMSGEAQRKGSPCCGASVVQGRCCACGRRQ
jgi:hypothetical protein